MQISQRRHTLAEHSASSSCSPLTGPRDWVSVLTCAKPGGSMQIPMLVPRKLPIRVEHHEGDEIKLTIPATATAVRIARVGAAGLGTRLGFSFAEVEDLRLAVGEAAAVLTSEHGAWVLGITYDVQASGLKVTLNLEDPDDEKAPIKLPDISGLTSSVLDTAVDAWEVDPSGTRILLYKVPRD